MSISLTCTCGALLEIDESFLGKTIPCPDCQRPLSTQAAPQAVHATAPLAVVGLVLNLAGAFTIVGPLAGGVCGLLAARQIQKAKGALAGQQLALASIILGLALPLATVGLLWAPTVFGLDSALRQYNVGKDLDYPPDLKAVFKDDRIHFDVSAVVPSASWGRVMRLDAKNETTNLEWVVANLWEDAHAVVLLATPDAEKPSATEALNHFLQSQFVSWLNGQKKKTFEMGEKGVKIENEIGEEDDSIVYFQSKFEAGGIPREFLFRVTIKRNRLFIAAAGARANRFARLEPELRKILQSVQDEDKDKGAGGL